MKRLCSLYRPSVRLGFACIACMVLLGCEDDTDLKTDLAQQDGPAAGKDLQAGEGTGTVDLRPDKAAVDAQASPDLPGPDQTSLDSAPEGDQGACQQDGQPCGGARGKCCSGLTCCTGMPVPPGKEYCAATCPKSDRNVKYGFKTTSGKRILEQLMRLPISTWTYNNEPPSVRHIGPMAQDFKAVFSVGADQRFISPLDAAGVSLISVQELTRQVKQLGRDVNALRQENRALRRTLRARGPGCRASSSSQGQRR